MPKKSLDLACFFWTSKYDSGRSDTPVTAAATTQVKICPYNEEEPHIWFRLIEAQFVAAGIRSQKLKYANALAHLPKQVLRDILDTLDVCNESDEPFNYLKNTLLGQFGKSKWRSYFELLRLPMEMQGLKPSVLMGKLKQHLPPGVSPDNDLFLAMFLVHLPQSMSETVAAGNHMTAAAMVKAADALRDARGGHDHTVAAATTQRSRSPAPKSGKRSDKRGSNSCSKSPPPSHPDFYSFQNPGNGVCKFHNYYANRAHRCAPPCAFAPNHFQPIQHTPLPGRCISQPMQDSFSLRTNWQMTGIWLILGRPWALFLATKITAHLVPFSKEQMGSQSPLGASSKKPCNFKANFSHPVFCKPLWPLPYWALTFWENSRSLLPQRSTKYSLLALQQPRPPPICLQRPWPPRHICLAFYRLQLRFQSSCQLWRLLQSLMPYPHMKSGILSFTTRGNQSLLNSPPLLKKYLILCLLMSKPYCKNSPLFFAPGMWCWHQPMGSSITSTPVAPPPPFLQNPAASIPKSRKLP